MTSTQPIDAAAPADIVYEPASLDPSAPGEMAPGLFGLRVPLPFALNHVNLWVLADGKGWTAVDAGLADPGTREIWGTLRARLLEDRPIGRLLVTHFHPDHMGLAGWLCAQTGAEFWTTRTEWLQGRMLALDASDAFVEAGRGFDRRAGLTLEQIDARARRGNAYRGRVVTPPASYRRVREGDVIRIDGCDWRVIIGRGHAPEMICLFEPARNVLIAGDQVLPRISPNLSVWPAEPLADPLAEFLESLECFRALPEDCLVLPSHGRPFRGLHARIDQLVEHHRERLDATLAACREPVTAAELMTALFDRALDEHQLGFALGESIAHANYLVAKGALRADEDADGRLRYGAR